ncbi:unnamed protein product [Cylindrotheca closterium]|uniref:Uncharacterized protein n=1 Tax=Cylindrotheca closterium TaxID=2856 RepID=A0AAD2PU38_9STRA|nr:unnamed protein product [Cylindrotheca closterium]
MSNNDNNNNKSSQEIRERQEEMQVLTRFKDVITNKLEKMTNETEDKQKVYKMGEHEKKVMMEMQGMGLFEGIVAGAATFLFLRRGPIWIGRFIAKRRGGGGGGGGSTGTTTNPNVSKNPFDNAAKSNNSNPMNTTTNSSGGYQLSNPFAANNNAAAAANNLNFPRSRNPIIRAIWFTFDATLSLMMAANISLQYTDLKRIRNDLVELPLAEGTSLVSDAFCEDLTRALQKVQRENSPAYQRLVAKYQDGSSKELSPLALYMEGITLFSHNCERRAFRQRELLQEQGNATDFSDFDDNNDVDVDNNNNNNNDNNTTTASDSSTSLSLDVGGGSSSSIITSSQGSIPIPPPGISKDGPRLVRSLPAEGTDSSMVMGKEEEEEEEFTVVFGDDSDSNNWERS